MATGLAPGFSYSGRHRLSYDEVKRLAKAFGLPGDAIAQIAKGESGLKADIQQRDPGDGMVGYGLLQMTPNAWGKGSAAYKHMQSLGGIEAMKDPVKNMAMARFLYKSAGNKLSPWHGTRFLTNRSGEGKLGPVDTSRVPSFGSSYSGGGGTTTTTTTTTGTPDMGSLQSALPLLQALTQGQQAPPSSSIQAPSFTAQAVMPQGFGTVSSGPTAPQGPDIGTLAAAVKTLGGNVPQAGVQSSTDTASTASPTTDVSGNYPGMKGAVKFAPSADRPGAHTKDLTKQFLQRVAGFSHRTISVGTGTNHNQFVVGTNRQSDHWTGQAADLPQPVDSKIGDLTAAHALEAAGVPWSQAIKMAQKGGVFNVTPKSGAFKGHRVQVLWKTMVGGNHHNHVHVGIR